MDNLNIITLTLLVSSIISVNQKSIVLRTAVENGGQAEYDFAFQQYKSTNDTSYLSAMASSRDPVKLNG